MELSELVGSASDGERGVLAGAEASGVDRGEVDARGVSGVSALFRGELARRTVDASLCTVPTAANRPALTASAPATAMMAALLMDATLRCLTGRSEPVGT